ncbi:hypothetical protein I3843_05G236100 [Carya illinoinensis]|uniref:Uncharacterized protein n=1 Tax=Carya illinoinensis TaxID=32201 RepID=A0A922F790_CARIL|nr:hypothetical protein I3760_05G260800 [Carya illinoinensis]KAG6715527.1 hypothetical protein I3842_05G257000 [Carya illinoinensis]KAG7981492.1 hypothetical protein I3843_05G236100 [Carya illinoinensis]
MDTPTENSPETEIIVPDSSNTTSTSQLSVHDVPLAEIQSKAPATEETLILLQRQRVSVSDFPTFIDEISRERDSLRGKVDEFEASLKEKEDEFAKKSEEELKKAEKLENQVEVSREIIQKLETEIEDRKDLFLDFIRKSKTSLKRIIESVDEDEEENVEVVSVEPASVAGVGIEEEEEIMETRRVALEAEEKVAKYKEKWKKEKRELEKSVVSLTEENRDINSLLRAALVEKEAVEKSLSKLKGINNNEQRRVALLQIAERGLQRVGFGFMMGAGTTTTSSSEQQPQTGSDTSECEEEEINDSLASTVERIMKNLRQEITKLRRSLEESRSDTERLQSLTEKQAQQIAENTLYIKELEDRERVLAQNIEELLVEIKEIDAEVARWREACELEVEAGKNEIIERNKVVDILKQELEKTRAALDISNGKLKLKEELAATAMAAQAAAERSLQLSDSRASGLRERIEELTRQLDEAESRVRNSHKIRHVCWPWRALKVNPANDATGRVQNARRMLPEMQALLHYNL